MAGIYIHIPYCKQKCSYCNFHFSIAQKNKGQMLASMKQEIIDRVNYLPDLDITSLYFGGGTPSLLTIDEIHGLINTVRDHYNLTDDIELTLEANPDDLNYEKLMEYRNIGFNRLSIGIQSFNDKDLITMNRAHSSSEATKSITDAKNAGFDNISIDLIYGLPEMDMDQWNKNVQMAIDSDIQHVSAYALTVEPNTLLNHHVSKGKILMPDQDLVSDQFLVLIDMLSEAHFEQYEVSNFGMSNYYSKHNSSYWQSKPYLGIGPSAHSFNLESRRWNVANNFNYIRSMAEKKEYFTVEEINKTTAFNEYVMLGLRTKWGINIEDIKSLFQIDITKDHIDWIVKYQRYFTGKSSEIILSKEGLLMADRIASDLMIVD